MPVVGRPKENLRDSAKGRFRAKTKGRAERIERLRRRRGALQGRARSEADLEESTEVVVTGRTTSAGANAMR
jgi:hypothetical protein